MILPIVKYGNPLLRRVSKPILYINQEIIDLSNDMIETMNSENGAGLSAVQIGKLIRLVVIDKEITGNNNPLILINPIILNSSDELYNNQEGCLSIRGIFEYVSRPQIITVKYIDINGKDNILSAINILSTCIQHEIDHLDGLLFIDRMEKVDRYMIESKLKKLNKENK